MNVVKVLVILMICGLVFLNVCLCAACSKMEQTMEKRHREDWIPDAQVIADHCCRDCTAKNRCKNNVYRCLRVAEILEKETIQNEQHQLET